MDFHYIFATDLRIISSNSRRFLPIARLAITRSGRDSRKFSITRYPRQRILLRPPISPLLLLPAVPRRAARAVLFNNLFCRVY